MLRSLLFACLIAVGVFAHADGIPRLVGKRLESPPKIEGDISDPVWKTAEHLTDFWDRFTSKRAVDQTEVWVGYDREAIYVAFYCHDSEPEKMVGREIQPGSEFNGEDTFQIKLNPFGNRNWNGVSRFQVNLLNTQSENIAGGRSSKREWRGIWQSATRKQKDGWTGSMRIPWKILNYPPGKRLDMDLNFDRFQARTQILSEWANLTPSERVELFGFWTGIEPPPADLRRKWEFQGYAAADFDSGTAGFRVGGDARFAPSPTTNALVSLSPDFKNIENQIASNEFTRTERFIGETRPFFTEGGDFFQIGQGFSYGQMLYTQRIGQFDVGGKYYGRPSPDLAIGVMTTERLGFESSAVASVTKNFTPVTYLSLSSTYLNRPGDLTQSTHTAEIGSRRGNLSGDIAATTVTNQGGKADTAGTASLIYSCPRWFGMVRGMWVQPDFDPALGYVPWTDRRGYYAYGEYNNEYRTGRLLRTNASMYAPNFETYAGAIQQRGYDCSVNFIDRRDIRYHIEADRTAYENGSDDVKNFGLTFNTSNRFRRFGINYENGYRADKPSSYLTMGLSWRVWRRLDISLNQAVLRYEGSDRQTIIAVGYELSPTRSLSGRFVDHNGDQNAYVAFRQAGGKGNEYYLIIGDPNATRTVSRVSFKVVWAF